MSFWFHGRFRGWGELHGVRGGHVQECRRLGGMRVVRCGHVRDDDGLLRLLNLPARLERGRDWARGGHGVHVLGGSHRGRRWAVHSVWSGDVQGRARECSVCEVSFGHVREYNPLQSVHALWGEHRVGGGEHSGKQLWLRTGLLGGSMAVRVLKFERLCI